MWPIGKRVFFIRRRSNKKYSRIQTNCVWKSSYSICLGCGSQQQGYYTYLFIPIPIFVQCTLCTHVSTHYMRKVLRWLKSIVFVHGKHIHLQSLWYLWPIPMTTGPVRSAERCDFCFDYVRSRLFRVIQTAHIADILNLYYICIVFIYIGTWYRQFLMCCCATEL